MREPVCAALEKRGYQVIKAANGPEAVAVWERSAAPIDLLLTDMVLPSGMNGGELARILQSRNPQLKVIYTSGYSTEILSKDSLLAKEMNFLPKPYNVEKLLKVVRTCLDECRLEAKAEPPPEATVTIE